MINYNNIRSGKNCVIWTRVSSKFQEDNGGSLKTQRERCEKYASDNNLKICKYFGGTHESAKTPGKLIKEMTKYVRKDKTISIIIVSEFDRFSRNLGQAAVIFDELREIGVIVAEAKTGRNTQNNGDMLMAQIMLSLAQWDNQNRTDKFVSGRQGCLRSGAWCEKAPLGYKKTGKSRDTWCYPDENGLLLKKAFKWKLEGIPSSEIVRRLAASGLEISQKTMHKIFVNPFYAGKIRHKLINNEMIDGQIEPIVSYKDFLKVQDILANRTGKYTHAKHNEKCPLTKYVKCYDDHTPFTSYTKTKKDKTFDYYKCNKQGCKTNVSAKEMHSKYESLLNRTELPEEMLMNFTDLLKDMFKDMNREQQSELTSLKKSRTMVEANIKSAKQRFVCGLVDEDDYADVIRDLNEQKDILQLQIDKLDYNLSNLEKSIPTIIATASNLSTLWHDSDYETKRRIEKLVYPDGIFWDKEIRNYRTEKRNSIFDLMDRFSMSYGNEKATSPLGEVALCGRRESNPYASRHQILSLACLPISTRPQHYFREKGLQMYDFL